jgi:hypothetical protein
LAELTEFQFNNKWVKGMSNLILGSIVAIGISWLIAYYLIEMEPLNE